MDSKIRSNNNSYKIYDCFMYYDEAMLLEFRLNYLNKHVDKFVIVECGFFHNGKKKKFNFNIDNYKNFYKKIIYIKVNKKPKNLLKIKKSDTQDRKNEKNILNGYIWDNYQRNKISDGLKKLDQNDIVIISDLDEIPKLENINLNDITNKIIIFRQKILFYRFNLEYKNRYWFGSRACKKKYLISPQWLRDVKHKKYRFWRLDTLFSKKKYLNIYHVKDGGWHFTNLKSPKDILKKLSNYAHYLEFSYSGLRIADIKKMILKKRAIYNHEIDQTINKFDGKIKLYKFNKKFWPEYLINNVEKYKKWII